jgi:opacity protein-like surface antigen
MRSYNLFILRTFFCLTVLFVCSISAYSQTVEKPIDEFVPKIITSEKTENTQTSLISESQTEIPEAETEPTVEKEISVADLLLKSKGDSSIPKKTIEFEKPQFHKTEPVADQPSDENKIEEKSALLDGRRAKWEIEGGSTEYGVEIGYAHEIATWMSGPKPWDIRGHRQFLASVRYGRILGTRGIVTFSYAIEFIPISLAIGNQTENKEFRTNPNVAPTKRTTNYGFAINPTSFRFIFFPKLRLRPFIFAGLGASYHIKPVPIESGTKWNMQFDFGVGGQYMLSKTKAVQFGYRYYHLSNVYLSNYNPGYNTNVFFVGYSVFKK